MSSIKKNIYTAGLHKCYHDNLLCNCKEQECIEQETFYRNNVMYQKHGNLPSYCIWTIYDINSQSNNQRQKWWEYISSTYLDNINYEV